MTRGCLREFVEPKYDGSSYLTLNIDHPDKLIDAIIEERLTDNSVLSKTRIAEIIFGDTYAKKIEFNLTERDSYIAKMQRE